MIILNKRQRARAMIPKMIKIGDPTNINTMDKINLKNFLNFEGLSLENN